MSQFSILQDYKLKAYPTNIRPPGHLTAWDKKTLAFLSQVGAAAYFQIAPIGRDRQKLDALHRAGLCFKYQLQGEKKINVSAAKHHNSVKDILKSLIVTQLVKQFNIPLEVRPGEGIIHSVIYINTNAYPVIVLRHGDPVSLLPFMACNYERLIIISEQYHPEFDKITIPVRIALDENLLSDDFYFTLPGGKREYFACDNL